jgi:DNA invertase Pin-like site-specific DNA recombinase
MNTDWTSVTATHLSRKAALYIRQSTLHQVRVHIGSTAVQMNQLEFIHRLGWPKDRVWILDGDMGITGTSAEARDDWQLLHEAIARGEVGVVAFSATSRASRSHRDFVVLVGACQLYDVLVLLDGQLVDPKIPGQRLMLGIRSVFDEYENDERIQRLRESKNALVKKGFAMSHPPVGYVSLGKPTRQWVKDPDPAVQHVITEVFTLYERLRSLRRVAVHLRDAGVLLPANGRTGGGTVWRPALASSVYRIVANPHYAGYYCWGKTQASLLFGRVERGPDKGRAKSRAVPRERWHLVDNHHEPYIEPDRFWRMRALAERSTFRHQQPPLRGAALVQGLAWCGDCDRRMYTQYRRIRNRIAADYVCPGPRRDPRDGKCRCHSALQIDPLVAARVVDVLRGLDLDLLRATLDRLRNESEARTAHLRQGCQIAEQEAKAAKERLKAADPRNERVFRLLESELEAALAEATRRKAEYDLALGVIPPPFSDDELARLRTLAEDYALIWDAPSTTHQDRKRLIRCLVERVIVRRRDDLGVEIEIVWHGGERTRLDFLPLGDLRKLAKRLLERGAWPEEIATALNAYDGIIGGRRSGAPYDAQVVIKTLRDLGVSVNLRRRKAELIRALLRQGLSADQVVEELKGRGVEVRPGQPFTRRHIRKHAYRLRAPRRSGDARNDMASSQEMSRSAHVVSTSEPDC